LLMPTILLLTARFFPRLVVRPSPAKGPDLPPVGEGPTPG
jgi:hypothetical protein